MRTCDIEGCEGKHVARGWCKRHYKSWKRRGTPYYVAPKTLKTFEQKLEEYTIPIPECGCWIWLAAQSSSGYGRTCINQIFIVAHRASWEYHNGPIPEGMHVLHKCDTPLCVNPNHLFLGTLKDNTQDAIRKKRQSNDKYTGKFIGPVVSKEGA